MDQIANSNTLSKLASVSPGVKKTNFTSSDVKLNTQRSLIRKPALPDFKSKEQEKVLPLPTTPFLKKNKGLAR